MFTYEFLQHYWWFIISLLGGLLVFLLFVQGGQSMLYSLPKNDKESMILVNALGRKWEYTFTTLVTFGGAFFASFPLFYSTSFSGAYWVWALILLCFVAQAVSYEYMNKPNNFLGAKTYKGFLFANGVLGTFLIGAAVATFYTGSEFSVGKGNIANVLVGDATHTVAISAWQNSLHGLEALASPRSWLLGIAVLFLARVLACLFFINRLQDENLVKRSRRHLIINTVPFLVGFLGFLIWTLLADGFGVDPTTKIVSMVPYKYFMNLIEIPIVAAFFLIGVVAVLWGIIKTILDSKYTAGIWFAGVGAVLTVTFLLVIAGWNNTAYYPSTYDLQSSLTIENSSSSLFTLEVMSVVSLLVPFVLAYIFYAWNALEKKKFDAKDLKEDGHVY